jgi:hypothetical protein
MLDDFCLVRDSRLSGSIRMHQALFTYSVDATTSLTGFFNYVAARAKIKGGKLKALFVLCHGYEGNGFDSGGKFHPFVTGGWGLQLGKEDLRHNNVSIWTAIQGKVENIVIYSCGTAETQYGQEGTGTDGRGLMSRLAKLTGAVVYAADATQYYSLGGMDFGKWEGNLWAFWPFGFYTQVARPPLEHWQMN